MDNERKLGQRGRPKGTGKKAQADERYLEQLADRKVDSPSMKTATIIKQLIDVRTDTGGLRRLERAFKQNEHRLLAAAHERAQERRSATLLQQFQAGIELCRELHGAVVAFDNSPKGQKFQATVNSFAHIAAELINSPQIQTWITFYRELRNSRPNKSMFP